jgi:hypothetical protein
MQAIITEGCLVQYNSKTYWVYEVKGLKLTLVPEDALDWDSGILKLSEAFQIPISKVSLKL